MDYSREDGVLPSDGPGISPIVAVSERAPASRNGAISATDLERKAFRRRERGPVVDRLRTDGRRRSVRRRFRRGITKAINNCVGYEGSSDCSMEGLFSARQTGRWLDQGIAVVGLLLAALMFPLRFFVSHIYASTLPIVLGVGCTLYLLADRTELRRIRGVALPTVSKWTARALPSVVFLFLSAMIVVATLSGRRTVPFYAMAIAASVLVLGQILFVPDEELHPRLLLVEALAVAGVVTFSALGTVPGFIGIDIWTHIGFARSILEAGSLSAIQGNKYYAAPVYHLYVGAGSLLGATSLRTATYLTVGLFLWLSPLFIYAAAREFVQPRWAVFAAAVFALSDEAIKWTLHLIPTSLAAAFYFVAFFLLVRVLRAKTERDSLMLTLFLVTVTLTHQVAAFIMLVLLLAAVAAQFVLYSDFPFREATPTSLISIVLFDAGLVTFVWSITPLNGDTFITRMLRTLQETIRTSVGLGPIDPTTGAETAQLPEAVVNTTLFETFVTYVNNLGFLVVLAAAIVGFLYVLRRQTATHQSLTLVTSATAMAVFALGLPLFGVSTFLPGRWYVFMYAPLIVGAAVGFAYLVKNLSPRATAAVFVAFLLLAPGAMIVSGDATYDNPPFASENPRYSYTESELAAMETLGSNLEADRPIYTDYPYTQLFERGPQHHNAAAAIVPVGDDGSPPHDDVLYREYQTTGAPYFAGENRSFNYVDSASRSQICSSDRSVVYTSGDVSLCTANPV